MSSLPIDTERPPEISPVKRAKRAVRSVTRGLRQQLIEGSPDWLRKALGPTANYLDMLFVDHGLLRLIYLNEHRLSANVWRSAQPGPYDVRRLKRDGIRTIVNLRGPRQCGSYFLEKRACEKAGIRLVDFTVFSRAAPSREQLYAVKALFETVEYPMLMHCKSGADRAGLMSALFKFLHEGVPLAEAKRQLSLRYGHVRSADTGILDAFFERYEADMRAKPMAFFEWVDTVYDPDALKRSFRASSFANRLVNSVLRRE
jgi:protein tyrosine phosphatase (PTP) superfamily phosphohydrolase (DUF442 family)